MYISTCISEYIHYSKSIKEIVANTTNDITFNGKRCLYQIVRKMNCKVIKFKESSWAEAPSLGSGTFPGLTHTYKLHNPLMWLSLLVTWGYSYLPRRVVMRNKCVTFLFFLVCPFFPSLLNDFQDVIIHEGDELGVVHWSHGAAHRPGSRQVAGEEQDLKKGIIGAAHGAGGCPLPLPPRGLSHSKC